MMTELKHVDQSSEDLKYAVFDSHINLNQFKILKVARWNPFNWLSLNMYILGESHAFEYFTPRDNATTEILSCSQSYPDGSLVEDTSIETFEHKFIDYSLMMQKQRISYQPNFNSEFELVRYMFPDNSYTAIGGFRTSPDSLILNSYHSYPKEQLIVQTSTFIERNLKSKIN